MVCNSEFRVNDEGLVRLGGIEPRTVLLRDYADRRPSPAARHTSSVR